MLKFFKWNKVLVMLGIMAGIVIISSLAIRWPINTFPAIEGNILDATTGEPIENVVISVNWIKSSPGPAGEITRTIKGDIVVTDKEGKYHILRLWSFHLFSVFSRGYVGFNHPLYASKQAVVARERRKIIIGSPALKAYPEAFEYKNSTIHYDISLLSLQEKYNKPEENFDLSSVILSYDNGFYFIILKEKGIELDLDNIFREWDRLAARFPNEIHFKQLNRRVRDAKERIKKVLKNLEETTER